MEILPKEFNEIIVIFFIKKDKDMDKTKSDNDSTKRGSMAKKSTRVDEFLRTLFKKLYICNIN